MPTTAANALNISSAGIVVFDGTATFSADTVTQHDVLVGGASNAITSVAPSATSGVPLVSGGASADPSFTTAVVAGGGTGVATFANTSALITTGTSSTGAVQNIASVATGQVLTSAGTSTIPAWSAAPTVTSIKFGAGTALSTYAEGTFTPTLIGGSVAGSTTYVDQEGYYTKIGNTVFIYARANISAATGSGNLTIGALPFTVKNQTQYNPLGSAYITGTALPAGTVSGILAVFPTNSTTCAFNTFSISGGVSAVQITNAAITCIISGFYQV